MDSIISLGDIKEMVPLTIPKLDTTQFKNNPFKRYSQLVNESKLKTSTPKILITSKFQHPEENACTLSKFKKFSNSDLKNIMKDKGASEVIAPEIEDESRENIKEEVENKDKQQKSIQNAKYKLRLTKEIEHNFSIMRMLRLPTKDEINSKKVTIPIEPNSTRISDKTLVLDLDGTLIHAVSPTFDYSRINVSVDSAETVYYKNEGEEEMKAIKIIVRPNAAKFLKEISKIYEIIVFLY